MKLMKIYIKFDAIGWMKQINITDNEFIYLDDNGKSIYKVNFHIYEYLSEVLRIFCNCPTVFLFLQAISFFFTPKIANVRFCFLLDWRTDWLAGSDSKWH